MARKKWTNNQFQRRVERLRVEGFTSEEAWDMAQWSHPLDHWVIRHMRQDRRKLVRNMTRRGMSPEEIAERLTRRYIDLGVRGQYEDEEWYAARVGA